jgi:hypothetical protein
MAAVAVVDEGNPFLEDETIGRLNSYTVSEEATPIVPGDTNGATPELTVDGVRNSRWALASHKPIELVTKFGTAHGVISSTVGGAKAPTVKYTADSLLNRLNTDVQAPPYYRLNGDLASDSFTRPNNPTSLGVLPTGQTWQAFSGEFGISANQAYISRAVFPSIAGVLTTSRNQVVSARITTGSAAGAFVGVVARMSDSKNYYFADFDGAGSWRLGKFVKGVYTNLGGGSGFVTGDVIRLQVYGNVLTLQRNSTAVRLIVDTSLTTGSWAGITANGPVINSTSRWDEFSVTEAATAFATDQPGTLYNAFTAWTRLVGIPDSSVIVDPEIQYMPVTLPGFVGNLWEHIKQFCTAYDLQCYSTGAKVGLTKVGKTVIEVTEPAGTTIDISQGEVSQCVQITDNRLSRTSLGVFFKSTEVYSVEAGEVSEFNVTVNGTPATVNNPVCVAGMDLKTTTGFGQYVVTGQDGYIIAPQLWRDMGGSITARVSTEQADEVIITITAPADESRAPYRISEGEDRPALWITGGGVLKDPEVITIYTGNSNAPTLTIDPPENIFISGGAQAYKAGAKLAKAYCGETVTLTMTGVPNLWLTNLAYTYTVPPYDTQYRIAEAELTEAFGFTSGAIMEYGDSKYRVITASYGNDRVDITMTRHVTFDDFNKVWAGKTFAQFNSAVGSEIEFSQFDIFPLTKEV